MTAQPTTEDHDHPRAGVVGWPVSHSRSPMIHRYWLKQFGIEGSYDPIPVPVEDAPAFFRDLRTSGLAGCNVTVPHKEIAAAACDVLDPVADALKAANTLWFEGPTLIGANTDSGGFLSSLDESVPAWDHAKGHAVIIGAGGAARAVAFALKLRGFEEISIVNRTADRAADIAKLIDGTVAYGFDAVPRLLSDCALLVNTTSLGMAGQPRLGIDLAPLQRQAIVTDIVYVPLETELLATARARGNRVVDGIGMLLYQAVPGFTRWFGKRPSVTPELRQLIIDSLTTPG